MEEILCSVCRRAMSPKELGNSRHATSGGEVICSHCLATLRELAPVRCHHCNAYMPPVSDGKTLFCRKCGAELGPAGKASVSVPTPRKPTGGFRRSCPYCGTAVRPDALRCSFCGASLAPANSEIEALLRNNRRLSFWLGALAAFCALAILLAITLYLGRRSFFGTTAAPTHTPTAAPTPAVPTLADKLGTLSEELQHLRANLSALSKDVAGLGQAKPSDKPTRPPANVPAPSPVPKPATPPPPDDAETRLIRDIAHGSPAAVPKPPGEPTPPDAAAAFLARAQTFYNFAKTTALAAERNQNFRQALKAWSAFPQEYKDTPWQQQLDEAKQRLVARAQAVQQQKFAEAEAHVKANDLDAARATYQWLIDHALPDAAAEATDKLESVDRMIALRNEQAKAAATRVVRQAQIQDLLNELRDPDNPVRTEAARKLGDLKATEAVADLIKALKDPDWFLAVRAAGALGAIGDSTAIPALIDAIAYPFPAVPAAAAAALETLSGQELGEDQQKWRAWWAANKDSLSPPQPKP